MVITMSTPSLPARRSRSAGNRSHCTAMFFVPIRRFIGKSSCALTPGNDFRRRSSASYSDRNALVSSICPGRSLHRFTLTSTLKPEACFRGPSGFATNRSSPFRWMRIASNDEVARKASTSNSDPPTRSTHIVVTPSYVIAFSDRAQPVPLESGRIPTRYPYLRRLRERAHRHGGDVALVDRRRLDRADERDIAAVA